MSCLRQVFDREQKEQAMKRECKIHLIVTLMGMVLCGPAIAQVSGPPRPGDPPSGVIGQVPGPRNPSLGTTQQELDAARAQAPGPGVGAVTGPGTQFGTGVESGAQIGGRTGTACTGSAARDPGCKPR
jgi:hypothetical protein